MTHRNVRLYDILWLVESDRNANRELGRVEDTLQ